MRHEQPSAAPTATRTRSRRPGSSSPAKPFMPTRSAGDAGHAQDADAVRVAVVAESPATPRSPSPAWAARQALAAREAGANVTGAHARAPAAATPRASHRPAGSAVRWPGRPCSRRGEEDEGLGRRVRSHFLFLSAARAQLRDLGELGAGSLGRRWPACTKSGARPGARPLRAAGRRRRARLHRAGKNTAFFVRRREVLGR